MAAHESFSREEEVQGSSDRSFGIIFTIFLSLVSLSPLRHHQPIRLWSLALALIFLGFALFAPKELGPLNRCWLKFGLLLQKITNPLVMAVLFYGLISPMAIVMKILGKDSLRRGKDPNAATYWIPRKPGGKFSETMRQQF